MHSKFTRLIFLILIASSCLTHSLNAYPARTYGSAYATGRYCCYLTPVVTVGVVSAALVYAVSLLSAKQAHYD